MAQCPAFGGPVRLWRMAREHVIPHLMRNLRASRYRWEFTECAQREFPPERPNAKALACSVGRGTPTLNTRYVLFEPAPACCTLEIELALMCLRASLEFLVIDKHERSTRFRGCHVPRVVFADSAVKICRQANVVFSIPETLQNVNVEMLFTRHCASSSSKGRRCAPRGSSRPNDRMPKP